MLFMLCLRRFETDIITSLKRITEHTARSYSQIYSAIYNNTMNFQVWWSCKRYLTTKTCKNGLLMNYKSGAHANQRETYCGQHGTGSMFYSTLAWTAVCHQSCVSVRTKLVHLNGSINTITPIAASSCDLLQACYSTVDSTELMCNRTTTGQSQVKMHQASRDYVELRQSR